MRWSGRVKRMQPVLEWHRWFAWYPVWLATDDWVWLETVWRRAINVYDTCTLWEHTLSGPDTE